MSNAQNSNYINKEKRIIKHSIQTTNTQQIDISMMTGKSQNQNSQNSNSQDQNSKRWYDISEITTLINSIPKILLYFIPGYLTLTIFSYLTTRKFQNNILFILSCALSYTYLPALKFIRFCVSKCKPIPKGLYIDIGIVITVGIVLALLFSWIYTSKIFSRILVKIFNKTPNDSIWKDIIDLKKGTNLKIYIKDSEYYVIGHFDTIEENGDLSWIAISAFAKYDVETNEPYKEEPSFLNNTLCKYVVRLSDIKHIELFS